ncbi:MAG: hypothetical protein J0G28_10110 [Afipia sp.]|nr:hypothetical protein [Afipia sp.]OJW62800.1 MAG: hypothetical protein BGO65_11195 [Afipia sp. 64-13]
MIDFYANESLLQAAFITLVLGGGGALLAGRAIAATWRNISTAALAAIPMAMAVRFVHFALFDETLLAPKPFALEFAILLLISLLSFRRTRAVQMVKQYYWLYRPRGPFGWQPRQDAPLDPPRS